MNYIIPALLKKTITFRRLSSKNVLRYEIYATYKDDEYGSSIKTELLDTIENPIIPNPITKKILLEYNNNFTWKLPDDAYLDKDHQFRLYINDNLLITLKYRFNRITKLITIDNSVRYTPDDKMELEYYQDIITKDYSLENDCRITVNPVFKDNYTYGFHNVIM